MRAALAIAALMLAAACTADETDRRLPPELAGLPMSELRVETGSGTHEFQVWIAADPASRERGLMFVRELPDDHGMLFLFERAQYTSFWMKDTYLSLDLVFIRGDGTISNIARHARPHSLEPIPSSAAVVAVLELLGGTADRIGLAPGDRVTLPSVAAVEGDARRREGAQ